MSQSKKKKQTTLLQKLQPFIVGSLSGCIASTVIQPVDTVKVLIQVRKEEAGMKKVNLSPFSIASQVIKNDGVKGLYKGLDSAILRQVLYASLRLGLYKTVEDHYMEHENRKLSFWEKVIASLATGAIGSYIANPSDVALVRFQADNNLPREERRNYKNVFDALSKILKQEGVAGLWRGSTPTVIRAMAVNSSQLVTYNQAKQSMLHLFNTKEESTYIRLLSSALSGVAVAVCSLPFDNIKTKLMRMKKNKEGVLPYKGFIDCIRKSTKNEGLIGLWVGLPTYYMRVGPHAMITVLVQDYLHDFFNNLHDSKH